MKTSSNKIAIILALLLFSSKALIFPKSIYACTCQFNSSFFSFWKAHTIFWGTAERVSADQQTIFKVNQAWKGINTAIVEVQGGGFCGVTYQENQDYLIYTWESNSMIQTTSCGNRVLQSQEQIEEEIKTLNAYYLAYYSLITLLSAGLILGVIKHKHLLHKPFGGKS